MGTEDVVNHKPDSSFRYFNPRIPGLEAMLCQEQAIDDSGQEQGFRFERSHGLNIVIYGPPGVGKTILALQMAAAAAFAGKKVLYFSKDTSSEVLYRRLYRPFRFFLEDRDWSDECLRETHGVGKEGKAIRSRYLPRHGASPGQVTKPEVQFSFLGGVLRGQDGHKDPSLPSQEGTDTFSEDFKRAWNARSRGLIGFADFTDAAFAVDKVDRYSLARSPYQAMGCLLPEFYPLFSKLDGSTTRDFLVVIDALSPAVLEEQLRMQAFFDSDQSSGGGQERPVFVYVMESAELPESSSVAFPPDVQIRLGIRKETHGVRTRTLQFVKTRFQKSLDEETAFVIRGAADQTEDILEVPIQCGPLKTRDSECQGDTSLIFTRKKAGVWIMPPLSHEAIHLRDVDGRSDRDIRFSIDGLDRFTQKVKQKTSGNDGGNTGEGEGGGLAGGGCTLLVTQGSCGEIPLSLHYLLAQLGEAASGGSEGSPPTDNEASYGRPRSVLYVNFSGDVEETLHTIWRHDVLRRAVCDGVEPANLETAWNEIRTNLHESAARQTGAEHRERHRLYKIPLSHRPETWPGGSCPQSGPYLYVYVPDFTWLTVEEAMERIAGVLRFQSHITDSESSKCLSCLKIDRAVLDRVGQVQARWPLIQDHKVFISGVVALCARHDVELLLVDDTAEEVPSTGLFTSRWTGAANNILRLRRMPFHGAEAITIDLLKATGRPITVKRPHEVVFGSEGSPEEFRSRVYVEDSFRGYTGLSIGKPERCRMRVELSYDLKGTALYRDVYATQQNLQAAMDGVEVRILGPREWSGINSAYNNLSSGSRDTCHIVAIDGIWLESLLEGNVLHKLSMDELRHLLPVHVKAADDPKKRELSWHDPRVLEESLAKRYVTRSLTTARANIRQKPGGKDREDGAIDLQFAVPMRHNWGVLAACSLSMQFLSHVFRALSSGVRGRRRQGSIMRSTRLTKIEYETFLRRCRGNPGNDKKDQHIRDTMYELLFGHPQDCDVAKHYLDVMGKVNGSKNRDWFTWTEIADFRTRVWAPFWRGGWFDQRLTSVTSSQGANVDPWLALLPRIDLFGLATANEESVVSFLLELLLAHVGWESLFGKTGKEPSLVPLRFQTHKECMKGFTETLVMFFKLLSPRQRRQLGIGVRNEHSDIGTINPGWLRLLESGHGEKAFAEWPSQVSLLSRQWITTVEDLLPRYDIRESIELVCLPSGDGCGSYWERLQRMGLSGARKQSYGIPVAGTWYLGVLRGGNTDLGADVMKEVLSKEHELQRLQERSGAPVSSHFYGEPFVGASDKGAMFHWLPYSDVMRELAPQGIIPQKVVFPFHRTQVANYLEVSKVFYDLVRHVMRIPIKDESLMSAESQAKLGEMVKQLVEKAFARLNSELGAATKG